MPKAVSKKQLRMMYAIMAGKGGSTARGDKGPPKSVAAQYVHEGGKGKKINYSKEDLPESKGQERNGGNWDHSEKKHRERDKERNKEKRITRGKEKAHKRSERSKKDLKKAFEDFYKGRAAAAIVMNANGEILMGRHESGKLAFAGGHFDDGDGSTEITALRELKEEMGIVGRNPQRIWTGKENGNDVDVFLVESFSGKLKSTEEIKNPSWIKVQDIEWSRVRDCCINPLKQFIGTKLGKSLQGMLALENLSKNIIRQRGDAVLEVTHGDALRLVGNGLFRKLKQAVDGMVDEDFKEVELSDHRLFIRKHMNDIYSGRVSDGHKVVWQFTNKSLPELTAGLMSVFEWYSLEDEGELELLDEGKLSDDAIEGGLNNLIENYKRHNIGNIYQEMETIREEIRNGVAVDLQQVEARMMKLFDKLESSVHQITDKHNKLSHMSGSDIDELEHKLHELQSKIDDVSRSSKVIEAYSSKPANPKKVLDENYPYLPKPQVEISPNGKIRITFGSEWTDLEKQNFLEDMKAKAIKRGK